jgi:ATP-dependent DNA helicase RecG
LPIPEAAIRETLLNALIHRDYAFSAGTLISIFDDRMEFVSIGGLVKGISFDDILLGISVPRNENLANIFYRLKLIEAYGTGIPKIMRSYADFSRKPLLQATDNAFKITLPNRNVSGGSSGAAVSFTENEAKVMSLFKSRPVIVRKDVETALDISQAMAVRILKALTDKRAIRSVGGGTRTRYEAL